MEEHALVLYKSIKDASGDGEVVRNLGRFNEYLSELCNSICPKGLKEKFIYQWTFKHEMGSKKDYESYCKANLFAARNSLIRFEKQFDGKRINEVTRKVLIDFVCDLKPFIANFDPKQDYSWLLANTNSHITNLYFKLAMNVFWHGAPGEHPEEQAVLSSSTPFFIRQCIEYKIRRILGVDYWLVDGKPDIRSVSKCFKAIDNNKIFYKTKSIDFEEVERIHSWTNIYIHGGYRPEPWRTETAITYLTELFYSGQTSINNSFSAYAGIEVLEKDLPTIKENTEKSIKDQCKGNVEIRWINMPEVAVIKNTTANSG